MKLKKKILMSNLVLSMTAMPIASLVACSSKETIDLTKQIVWYYDNSGNDSEKTKEVVNLIIKRYNQLQDESLKKGTLKSKVKLIARPGNTAYWAQEQMLKLWGYSNSKSPDLWLGAATDLSRYSSASGKSVVHQFNDEEYNQFWEAAGFEDESKAAKVDGVGIESGKKVRITLPWFNKGFFYIKYSKNPRGKNNYDKTLNEKLKNGQVKLSSSKFNDWNSLDIDLRKAVIGLNNNWNHNPFSNAIFKYLRGDNILSPHNTNGFSGSINDFAFIPQASKSQLDSSSKIKKLKDSTSLKLQSILFKNDQGKTPSSLKSNNKYELSDLGIAYFHMLFDPQAQDDYNSADEIQKNRLNQGSHIGSMGYNTLPVKFRNAKGEIASIDTTTVTGFMGAKASTRKNSKTEGNTKDTLANDHRYEHLLGAGIDWVKYLSFNLWDKMLTSRNKVDINYVNDKLKHFNIYRMPKKWQMDDSEARNMQISRRVDQKQAVAALDGVPIAGIADRKSTIHNIFPMSDGDFLTFNQRTWEIEDKNVRENKIVALKLLVKALYYDGDDNKDGKLDYEAADLYAKKLLDQQGTFSAKKSLLLAGAPKPDQNGDFPSQKDRLWNETILAISALDPPDNNSSRVNSDFSGFQQYWGKWSNIMIEQASGLTPLKAATLWANSWKTAFIKANKPSLWGTPTDESF